MWFIGLLLGAVIGANFSGVAGAILGAILGGFIGWLLKALSDESKQRLKKLEDKAEHIYRALADIHNRLAALEKAAPEPRRQEAEPSVELSSPTKQVPPAIKPVEQLITRTAVSDKPQAVLAIPTEVVEEVNAAPPWWRALFGGNLLVKIGVVILFIGIGFLVKFAAEYGWFPIELRLTGVALVALTMLFIGWRLRERRTDYALAMQGGGIGIFYLNVYAALQIYHLLSAGPAFSLMAVIAATSALLAVKQDSRALAVLGIAGGFLAPILASTGKGDHVLLFSYYALINLGVFIITWFKAWRPLNLLSFFATAAIGLLWGERSYREELFNSVEPFVLLFFLFFNVIAILYARKQAPDLKSPVDATLVFGTPLISFAFQSVLLQPYEYGLAFCALAYAAFYILVGSFLNTRERDKFYLLTQTFLALGIVFATLAIPLALDGRWTATAWAVEGAGILWVGIKQNSRLARVFGALLQIGAGVFFIVDLPLSFGGSPFWNNYYLGTLLLSVAGLFSAWILYRHREDNLDRLDAFMSVSLFVWGTLWWYGGAISELDSQVAVVHFANSVLIFCALSSMLFSILAQKLDWPLARFPAFALLPIAVLSLVWAMVRVDHPCEAWGVFAWPLAMIANYFVLYRHDLLDTLAGTFHAVSLWVLTALGAWEVFWLIDRAVSGEGAWATVAWMIVPSLFLFALTRLRNSERWPIAQYRAAYMRIGGAGLACYLLVWSLAQSVAHSGNPYPLIYLPLLNPLDIAQVFVLLALWWWYTTLAHMGLFDRAEDSPRLHYAVLGVLVFVWLNAVLMRSIHHWSGVPYTPEELFRSMSAQATVAIFWTLSALSLMIFATRRGVRALWMVGAALLSVVIVKLLLIDLWNIGGVERIVAFIGVAVLVIVIGYFSPLPPGIENQEKRV